MIKTVTLIENGSEIDWIDPVIDIQETENHWVIDNGFHIYEWKKKNGRTIAMHTMTSKDANHE